MRVHVYIPTVPPVAHARHLPNMRKTLFINTIKAILTSYYIRLTNVDVLDKMPYKLSHAQSERLL